MNEINNNEQSVNTFLKEFYDANYNENKFIKAAKELREYLKHGSAKSIADMILR